MDEKPFYYKGFRRVLSNKKTFKEITGSSRLPDLNLYLKDLMAKKEISV